MPKPEVSWFHNQRPVQPTKNLVFHFDEATNTATLIIVDAFTEHAGQYTCRAANSAGEAACSATLTITKVQEEGNLWIPPRSQISSESPSCKGCPNQSYDAQNDQPIITLTTTIIIMIIIITVIIMT